MITLSKSGSTVTFTFDENSGYLQNGTIDVPVNSLSLITDESDMATFRKSASNDIFISARYEEFGMTKAELEAWYKENMVGATGGGGGVTSGEVQTMIDESISGLAESSAVTQEISAAVSGKIDSDSAVTDVRVLTVSQQNELQITQSKGGSTASTFVGTVYRIGSGLTWNYQTKNIAIDSNTVALKSDIPSACTVDETIVYNTFADRDMFDYQGEYKYEYAIINFKGDKTTETKGLYCIAGNTSGDYASGYIYLDYPNHSASTDGNTALTEYFTIEYISDINDFKISIAPAYQSTCWIKTIQNLYNTEAKFEFYKINSGSPCTVIETDVVGLVEKVKDIADSSVRNVSITSQKNKLESSFSSNKGYAGTSVVKLEEIDGTNNILKPAIKIPLGVSGWTELSFSETCTLYDVNATTIRVTYDYETFNADYMYLLIVSDTDGWEHYDNVTFSWETELPTFSSDYFTTGVTMTWSASTKELVVEYPATVEEGGSVKNVKITRLNSPNCQLGQFVSKVETYGELKQDLKPYVQETRAALSGKQDTLTAGSGITISGNVISADAQPITVDTALDSGSTNPVENRVIYNKFDEVEEVTAAALNNINDRLSEDEEVTAAGLNAIDEKFDGMKLKKISQTDYDNLQTKDSNTLYVIVN